MKSLEEVACLEQMNRVGDKAGKVRRGRQCLATNFLFSWNVAGVIAELETKAMFPDLGSKKIHWIHCVRQDSGAEKRQAIDQRGCRTSL